VDKLPNWFQHKSRRGIECHASIQHYQLKNTKKPYLSNCYLECDPESDDDFKKMVNSVGFIWEFFGQYQIAPEDFRYWYSGRRSFHIELPYQFFGVGPTVNLHFYWQYLASMLNDLKMLKQAGFDEINGHRDAPTAEPTERPITTASPSEANPSSPLACRGKSTPDHPSRSRIPYINDQPTHTNRATRFRRPINNELI